MKKARANSHDQHGVSAVQEVASPSAMPSQMSSDGSSITGSGQIHYLNGNLPYELQEDRKWMKQILPALIMWAGNQPDPWIITDQNLVGVLHAIIVCVVPHFQDLSVVTILFPHRSILLFTHTRCLLTWRGRRLYTNTSYLFIHTVSSFCFFDLSMDLTNS